jgi:hypothetical protein
MFGGIAATVVGVGQPSGNGVEGTAVLFGASVALALYAWRSAITLTPDNLVISTMFRRRSIPLAQITGVTPGYSGIAITTNEGKTYTASAVQKNNYSWWLGRHTHADDVADVIRGAAGIRVPSPQGSHRQGDDRAESSDGHHRP